MRKGYVRDSRVIDLESLQYTFFVLFGPKIAMIYFKSTGESPRDNKEFCEINLLNV